MAFNYIEMQSTASRLLRKFGVSVRVGKVINDTHNPVTQAINAARAYDFTGRENVKAVWMSRTKIPNLDKQYQEGLKKGIFQLVALQGNHVIDSPDVIDRDGNYFEVMQVTPVKPASVIVLNFAVVRSSPVLSGQGKDTGSGEDLGGD